MIHNNPPHVVVVFVVAAPIVVSVQCLSLRSIGNEQQLGVLFFDVIVFSVGLGMAER